MMTKESTKIVKFYLITHGAGVFVLGRGHDYTLFHTLSIYNALIGIVLREYNAAFLCHC